MTKTKLSDPIVRAGAARTLNGSYDRIVPWHVKGTVIHVHTDESLPREEAPAPAWYNPATADIAVHLGAAGIDSLEEVYTASSPHVAYMDKTAAALVGLIVHEAAHAKWSGWLTPALQLGTKNPLVIELLQIFEELRIERAAVDTNVDHVRAALRASFKQIILGTGKTAAPTTNFGASTTWALVWGRMLAGTCEWAEVEAVDTAARTLLGDDIMEQLLDLLQEAVVITAKSDTSDGAKRLVEIARDWIDIVGLPKGEGGGEGGHTCGIPTNPDGTPVAGGKGKPTEEGTDGKGGDGSGSTDGKAGDKSGAGGAPKAGTASGADDDADGSGGLGTVDSMHDVHGDYDAEEDFTPAEAAIMTKAVAEVADDVTDDWKEGSVKIGNATEFAKKVFGGKPRQNVDTRNWTVTLPTAQNRRDVTRIARVLETLAVPAISKSKVAGELPPGRLRTREAVRAGADRAAGRMTDARPWQATKRRHSASKPVFVGIATDTSGSMGWAEQAVADYAYVLSNAGIRIGARTAAVTFGNKAEYVTRPGQPATHVHTRQANGHWEAFDDAIAALDGVLHLTVKNGAAKVLLIVSDGHLVRAGETKKASIWMQKMADAGVTVIWISNNDEKYIKSIAPKATALRVRYHYAAPEGEVSAALIDATINAIAKAEKNGNGKAVR